MGARSKLNAAAIYFSFIFAAFAGAVCQSWAVFFVVLGLLIVAGLVAGSIRPTPRRRG